MRLRESFVCLRGVVRRSYKMNDCRVTLTMFLALRFGECEKLFLRPTAIQPVRERVKRAAMAQEDAPICSYISSTSNHYCSLTPLYRDLGT